MYVIKEDLANQKIKIVFRHKDYSSENVEVRSYNNKQLQSDTPTIADWSATSDDEVGQGAEYMDVISVTDASDVDTGAAFITDPEGFWERIDIKGVDTTQNELLLSAYPARQYSSGSVITPAEGYITVGSDVYDDERNIFVIVSYLSDGELISWQESGYVHERPIGNPVSDDHLFRKWPELKENQYNSNRGHTYTDLLKVAFDSIRSRIWSMGKTIEMFKGGSSVLQETIIYEFGRNLAEMGITPFSDVNALEFHEMMQNKFEEKWAELMHTEQWVDLDDSDSESIDEKMTGKRLKW